MNKISFKATISGIDDSLTKFSFMNKTHTDTKHHIVYEGKDSDTEWEKFTLMKNGETTVKNYPFFKIKSNNGEFTIDQLLKIFNMLKIKEAQNFIAKQRKIKAEKEYLEMLKELEQE